MDRFSQLYLKTDELLQDSKRMRQRLTSFIDHLGEGDRKLIANLIKQELGIPVEVSRYGYIAINEIILSGALRDVLDLVTIIFDVVKNRYEPESIVWRNFVHRVFNEESLSYKVDKKCVVHYKIDEEFERNYVSAIKVLENERYVGVRSHIEDALKNFKSDPVDTKAVLRCSFESVEILAKLIIPSAPRLNKSLIENDLKKKFLEEYKADPILLKVTENIFSGVALWFDALHTYRHGQKEDKGIKPPIDFTIYVLSSSLSFIRLLVTIDKPTSITR